jgi:hypothetical protein
VGAECTVRRYALSTQAVSDDRRGLAGHDFGGLGLGGLADGDGDAGYGVQKRGSRPAWTR